MFYSCTCTYDAADSDVNWDAAFMIHGMVGKHDQAPWTIHIRAPWTIRILRGILWHLVTRNYVIYSHRNLDVWCHHYIYNYLFILLLWRQHPSMLVIYYESGAGREQRLTSWSVLFKKSPQAVYAACWGGSETTGIAHHAKEERDGWKFSFDL